MHSLSQRLLVSVSIPLAVFFGAMMMVLDRGFRELGDRSLQQLLDSQMVALIAAAEPQPDGKYAPESNDLAARMRTPRSGLYAQIVSSKNKEPWRSPSTAGSSIDFGPTRAAGVRDISYGDNGHERIEIESRGIEFEDRTGHVELTFSVAASLTPYEQQLWAFRRQLFGWFSGLMLLLLAALAGVLRWVLSPVRRMEREIRAVEEGRSDALGGGYPRELSGVATNLNTLLIGERKRVTRYRDTLGNLAHSLKTPLAVMRAAITSNSGVSEGVINPEIDKMSAIIEHQLKRAASGGALLGQAPLDIAPIVSELRVALLKVYARKDLSIELVVAPACQFIGDRGDLTELLGNVLDNACKWCRSVVRLTVSLDGAVETRQKLSILVEDDGPGISAEDRIRIGQRGVRTDETVPGHGIGLSMVQDTVELYSGAMTIGASSALGGAAFEIRLPGR